MTCSDKLVNKPYGGTLVYRLMDEDENWVPGAKCPTIAYEILYFLWYWYIDVNILV